MCLKWRISSQTSSKQSCKNKKIWIFPTGLKYTLRTCFESKNFLPKSCPEPVWLKIHHLSSHKDLLPRGFICKSISIKRISVHFRRPAALIQSVLGTFYSRCNEKRAICMKGFLNLVSNIPLVHQ